MKLGVSLAVTAVLLIVFATSHFENADLVVLAMRHNSGFHGGACQPRRSDLNFRTLTKCENLIDNDVLANFRSYLFYLDLFAGSNFVLFASGFYDRVHVCPFNSKFSGRLALASLLGRIRRLRHRPGHAIVSCVEREAQQYSISTMPTSKSSSLQKTDHMLAEMQQVDEVIRLRLVSQVALIDQISGYIISAGGKRIRPRLVLLFAQALGFEGSARYDLAAIIEFIHTATLLHDDVVDESALRRGRATANAVFGNAASVLVGDFLYSRAFQMMVSVSNLRVLEVLADATNVIAEGEVLQLLNMHDPDLAVSEYLRVIRFKTAKLFEASARLGAVISGATNEVEEACASYGRALGTAFQLIDDLLDYEGDSRELGKNIGDDLREGKPTLPMLIAMSRCNDEERLLLRHAIKNGAADELDEILAIVRRTGALDATRQAAALETGKARASIECLPASMAKAALLELCSSAVTRSS